MVAPAPDNVEITVRARTRARRALRPPCRGGLSFEGPGVGADNANARCDTRSNA